MRWVGYQQRYLADRSTQRAVVKSRRIGFTEVVGFRKACRAVGVDLAASPPRQVRPVDVNVVSAGLEQSKDVLVRMLVHLRALGKAFPSGDIVEKDNALAIKIMNGRTIRAFSSNPKTIRSYGGDLVLDEYGAMPHAKEVWAAGSSLAKPTLGNPNGFEIDIIGTPEGDDNMFHRICKGSMAGAFSHHEVNVHQAVADGFPLAVKMEDGEYRPGTIDDLREEIGDPDIFAQEYECSFLSANMRYIDAAIYDRAVYYPEDAPSQDALERDALLYGGMDVARTKHNSVIVLGDTIGDTCWERETQYERNMPWADQEAWVDRVIRMGVRRLPVDATGLGSKFAEDLATRHGDRIEPVNFNLQSKEDLASTLKLALEGSQPTTNRQRLRFRPRADNTRLRRDVLALRRLTTSAGNVRYDAPQDKRGHADGAWAAGLMLHGQTAVAKTPKLYPVKQPARVRPVERMKRPI